MTHDTVTFSKAELVEIADSYFQRSLCSCPRDGTRLSLEEEAPLGRRTIDFYVRCPRCGREGWYEGEEPDREAEAWDWDPEARAVIVDDYWRNKRAVCPVDLTLLTVREVREGGGGPSGTPIFVRCRRCGRGFISDEVEIGPPPRHTFEDRFEVLQLLGKGGMGEVSLVKERKTGLLFAAKEIRANAADPEGLARFRREIRVLRTLAHPNVVRLVADFLSRTRPLYVMEYLEGGHMGSLINKASVPTDRLVRLFASAVAGVEHLHEKGIVHRDLKPPNILVGDDDRACVGDLGLAHVTESTVLTRTGEVMGTDLYMAPEQKAGEKANAASDVYALGLIAYEISTRRSPYVNLAPLQGPFWNVLRRALDPDPERRTVTPRELVEALRSYVATSAPVRPQVASDIVTEVINPGADFTLLVSVPMSGDLDTHLAARGYRRTGQRGRPSKGELYLGRGDGLQRGIYRRERESDPGGYSGADTFEILERV